MVVKHKCGSGSYFTGLAQTLLPGIGYCTVPCQSVHSLTDADRVYVSLGTAGTYPGYGPVYRNVPW